MIFFPGARVRHGLVIGLQISSLLFSRSLAQTTELQVMELTQNVVSKVTRGELRPGAPEALKEIRIATTQDFTALYPLISAYVAEPELALSVTNVILDAEGWSKYLNWGWMCGERTPPERQPIDEATHAAIKDHVRGIGLSPETTKAMLASLTWKKHQLLGLDTGPGPDDTTTTDELETAFIQTAAILLLTLCPNLTHLQISYLAHLSPNTVLLQEYLLKNNHALLPPHALSLQHLTHLTTAPHSSRHGTGMYTRAAFLDHLRCFGRLPSLTTYAAHGVSEYDMERTAAPLGTSTVRRLHLSRVDISGSTLRTLMLIPEELDEFKLSLGGMLHEYGADPDVPPRMVGEALLEHRETLRVVELDLVRGVFERVLGHYHDEEEEGEEEDEWEVEEWEVEYQMSFRDEYYRLEEGLSVRGDGAGRGGEWGFGATVGSFRGYTALKELGVSVTVLLGPPEGSQHRVYRPSPCGRGLGMRLVDLLPEGLEVLRLFEYVKGRWPDYDAQVRELLEVRAEKFPGLTLVEGVEEPIFMLPKDERRLDQSYAW
jgi:hypothetical protein